MIESSAKLTSFLLLAISLTGIVFAHAATPRSESDELWRFINTELNFLSRIPSRKTGSKQHNQLIDHIKEDLESLELKIYSETWHFNYNESPLTSPKLSIEGESIPVSADVPYSGNTGTEGVSGPLINLISPNITPEWKKARGGIAVVNLTNAAQDRAALIPLWPGSPSWRPSYVQLPSGTANALVVNLTDAADAGVRGIVYVWEHLSTELAAGQYGPFWIDYQGIPALYASPEVMNTVVKAASRKKKATLTLTGRLIPNTPTRNIWAIIPGTERPHESVLINTHTDGVNIGEENGHIALLAYARSLVKHPPKRTTILAFITGHIHSAPFSYSTHRSTTLWLADNPSLWDGTSENHLKAVFGSCVEHLGMIEFIEDLSANTYTPTKYPADEVLYAATSQLADLVFKEWSGAMPNTTRVINPNLGPAQGGEGLPFLLNHIPEVSLVTAPAWLLKQFPKSTDERKLIDVGAVYRQIKSFERIWRKVDGLPRAMLGNV